MVNLSVHNAALVGLLAVVLGRSCCGVFGRVRGPVIVEGLVTSPVSFVSSAEPSDQKWWHHTICLILPVLAVRSVLRRSNPPLSSVSDLPRDSFVPVFLPAQTMASALVDALSPTSETRAGHEHQFSRHEDGLQREVGHPETLEATAEMCAYCFGASQRGPTRLAEEGGQDVEGHPVRKFRVTLKLLFDVATKVPAFGDRQPTVKSRGVVEMYPCSPFLGVTAYAVLSVRTYPAGAESRGHDSPGS